MRDDGRGIPGENLAHVSELFFTTKRSDGGTGLGLATVTSILDSVGGGLQLRSTPGEGTTAEALLPLAAVAAEPPRPPGQERPGSAERRVVLVVEDEPTVLRIVAEALRVAGIEVAARAAAVRPGVPIPCISGNTQNESTRRAIADGVCDFLPKPFAPSDLLRLVREIFARETAR